MAKQRIGIIKCTFDPVHDGQIRIGLDVLDAGPADLVLMVLSESSSSGSCASGAEDRWRMLVSACASDKRLVPFRPEADRDAPAGILKTAGKAFPKAELFFAAVPDQTASAVSSASSEIRLALSGGRIPAGLNVAVREYISCKGLYGMPGMSGEVSRWIDDLFAALNPHRFAHSLSVAFAAKRLAARHGIDPLLAEQAGILHDCAKCFPLKEMQKIAVKYALTSDSHVLESGALLHSLVGAWVAENRYGMSDPAVLEAIAYHNTGHPGMSRLAMCVCLSDSIEPLRESYPLLERIRALAEDSLEQALLLSLESTADYVRSRGKYLHPQTEDTIAWLRTLPETQKQD